MSKTQLTTGILALQEQKRELAKAALSGKGAKNIMKLTMDDIMSESGLMFDLTFRIVPAITPSRPKRH